MERKIKDRGIIIPAFSNQETVAKFSALYKAKFKSFTLCNKDLGKRTAILQNQIFYIGVSSKGKAGVFLIPKKKVEKDDFYHCLQERHGQRYFAAIKEVLEEMGIKKEL